MTSDSVYEEYVASRTRLIERSRVTREELDSWVKTHRTLDAGLSDLAQLEGVLKVRRELLGQLQDLDDNLMDHLLSRRRENTDGDTQAAPPDSVTRTNEFTG